MTGPHVDPVPRSGTTGSDATQVLGAIRALSQGIDRYRRALAERMGIGLPEVHTLAQLMFVDSMRAGDIAELVGLNQSSVTALLDRLERRGLIIRVRPPDNRRVVQIHLTDTGRRLGTDMYRPLLPLLEHAAGEDGAPDPDQLTHCLHRIGSLFDQLSRDHSPSTGQKQTGQKQAGQKQTGQT